MGTKGKRGEKKRRKRGGERRRVGGGGSPAPGVSTTYYSTVHYSLPLFLRSGRSGLLRRRTGKRTDEEGKDLLLLRFHLPVFDVPLWVGFLREEGAGRWLGSGPAEGGKETGRGKGGLGGYSLGAAPVRR